MNEERRGRTQANRICPYYRLPQLIPVDAPDAERDLPICSAQSPSAPIRLEHAANMCRSGRYPQCSRYPKPLVQHATSDNATHPDYEDLTRKLFTSALWVIGIPVGITLLLVLAMWFTENIWTPPQLIPGMML